MSSFLTHAAFDVLAWLAAGAAALWVARAANVAFPVPEPLRLPYVAALVLGAAAGAYLFGTANLWLSQQAGVARSIEGAHCRRHRRGRALQARAGITQPTGARFALPLAVGIAVGRIGCFFAGLDDFTYGMPTALPWGLDFGDGIPRHPVQLYESAAMPAFAVVYLARAAQRPVRDRATGSISRSASTALQRFVWEFFKPYGTLVRAAHAVSSPVGRRDRLCCRHDRDRAPKPEKTPPMTAPLRKSPPLHLLRPDHVAVRDLPRRWCRPRSRSRTTRSGTRSAAPARRAVDADLDRRGLLAALQGLHQAGRPAAHVPEPHRIRLPLRLRPVPRPRAAFLPRAGRDQRGLQSDLPGVLRRFLAGAQRAPAARRPSSACSTRWSRARASPTSCSSPAASRRSIRSSSTILDACARRPIRHVMINTNGVRIAHEPDFVARLAEQPAGLEVYLQFDSLRREALMDLRGADLRRVRAGGARESRAAQHLDHAGRDGEERRQRRRDRRHRPPCARMALRARRHLPAGPGRRPQRDFRQGARPRAAVRHPAARRRRLRRVRRRPT